MKTYIKRNYPLLLLLTVGLILRIYGLKNNYSFWSDEEMVAVFVRAILKRGRPVLANGATTGSYLWLYYWLEAVFAAVFGLTEFGLRISSVIFGTLTIWATFLLGKEVFNRKVGLIGAFLATFLKIEILWSRQARPYQILQFLYLLGAYFLYKIIKSSGNRGKVIGWYFLGFFLCGATAPLFHGLGLVILISGLLVILVTKFDQIKPKLIPMMIILFLVSLPFYSSLIKTFGLIGRINYLFYYRVFLVHNYFALFFLTCLGWFFLIYKKRFTQFWLFFVFIITQGFLVSFLVGQSFIRYFYVVFPFIILLASYCLTELADLKKKRFYLITLIILAFSLVGKIVFIPRSFYFLNEDMQETPEVDWKKVYSFTDKLIRQNPGTVLLVNWPTSAIWYLGEERSDFNLKLLRKGPARFQAEYFLNVPFVDILPNLIKLKQEQPKGIVVIDSWDDYVPEGVREYIGKNFKKELVVDRLYPLQPRYWPVEVFSWGIK